MLPEPATFGQYLRYCAGVWYCWRNLTWMIRHARGFVHPASASCVPAGAFSRYHAPGHRGPQRVFQ